MGTCIVTDTALHTLMGLARTYSTDNILLLTDAQYPNQDAHNIY